MMDTYDSFKALKEDETNYHIKWKDRNAQITILAPHGGNIEPHTSEIAELVAAGSDMVRHEALLDGRQVVEEILGDVEDPPALVNRVPAKAEPPREVDVLSFASCVDVE